MTERTKKKQGNKIKMGQRALVTGGAGFIGSHIQDALIKEGFEVAVLDNLRSGKRENLNPAAKFYFCDIRDKEVVDVVFNEFKPHYVFHQAAQNEARPSMKFPAYDAEVNIIGTIHLLESCRRVGTKKIVYASSGGTVYGEVPPEKMPIPEDYPLDEPASAYGISKHTVEHYLKLYERSYGLKWTALRYPNVYGPRQDGNAEAGVIAIFTTLMMQGKRPTINGDGTVLRDYTHVDDIVAANLSALKKGDNEAFNLGTGKETSVQEVFDTLEKHLKTGLKPIYGPAALGDVPRILLDTTKAQRDLGWQARYEFERGVRQTIKYYRQLVS